MDRIDYAICALTALLTAPGVLLSDTAADRFVALVVVWTLGAAAIAANHAIPRRPKLSVAYHTLTGEPAFLWRDVSGGQVPNAQVVVSNHGRGDAEAVEVRFSRLNANHVLNETGNLPRDVDATVDPPRFTAGSRVLGAGQEWVIARLLWLHGVSGPVRAEWTASARGARPTSGVVDIPVHDDPKPTG
jgi:hypothetical protein